MDYLDQDTGNCSIGRTVEAIGESWTLLIVREAALGVHRFSDLQDHLDISRSVLARRLDQLVAEGILERSEYRDEGQPARSEYVLTAKGRELHIILAALRDWGDRHVADPEGPAMIITHRGCGEPVHAVMMCDAGHVIEGMEETEVHAGPSTRARVAA
jgi:DNA-binding HxlR family transcriptional regulator